MGCYDSNPLPQLSDADLVRFWSQVDRSNPNGCWPWIGNRIKDGYGRFYAARAKVEAKAHRIAYFLNTGVDPKGLLVCHSCDNPPCCRGSHLEAKTQIDNMADMRSRFRKPKGEDSHVAKLSNAQVGEIRERYAAGGIFIRDLARLYVISKSAVHLIVNHKTYRI